MSEIFDGYKRRYCELSANLSRKCTFVPALRGEENKHKLTELKTRLDEADLLIRLMDLEARSLLPTEKTMLLAKLREYLTDIVGTRVLHGMFGESVQCKTLEEDEYLVQF